MPSTVILKCPDQKGRIYTGELPSKLKLDYPESFKGGPAHQLRYFDGKEEDGTFFSFTHYLHTERETVKVNETNTRRSEISQSHEFGVKKDGSVHYRWTRRNVSTHQKFLVISGPKAGQMTHDAGPGYSTVNKAGKNAESRKLPKVMWVFVPGVEQYMKQNGH